LIYFVALPVGTLVSQEIRAREAKEEAQRQAQRANKLQQEQDALANQRAQYRAHVDKKVQIIQTLSDAMVADGVEDWANARKRWKELKKNLVDEKRLYPWWQELLGGALMEQVERPMQTYASRVEMRGPLRKLSQYLREAIQDAGDEYLACLGDKRETWFKEIKETAKQIRHWARDQNTPKGLSVSRRKLYELYYGEMALVERKAVFEAMEEYFLVWTEWDKAEEKIETELLRRLEAAEERLRDACDRELQSALVDP
jgi:hypothetical protein